MLGIVLCGGQSSRMGNDKGLLNLETKTWAQTSIDKLESLQIPVKLSINNDQLPVYAPAFSSSDLIVDDPSLTVKGPLLGVLSCHLQWPAEDLYILACDMPLMEISLLKELYTLYQRQSSAGAYVFTNDDEPEPLCGIYRANGLSFILELLQSGRQDKHSMKNMLDQLEVVSIALPDDQKKSFRNFNSPAELNGL
jgi:molybdopterin-guanine dinucleotide biosynthesis protein A